MPVLEGRGPGPWEGPELGVPGVWGSDAEGSKVEPGPGETTVGGTGPTDSSLPRQKEGVGRQVPSREVAPTDSEATCFEAGPAVGRPELWVPSSWEMEVALWLLW